MIPGTSRSSTNCIGSASFPTTARAWTAWPPESLWPQTRRRSPTAGRMSKGVAPPAAMRTAATVVGIS